MNISTGIRIAVAGLGLLAAASGAAAQQTMDEVRTKWQGRPVAELFAQHGDPDSTYKTPEGNTVYIYVKVKKKFELIPVFRQRQEQEVSLYTPATGQVSAGTVTTKEGLDIQHRQKDTTCSGYFETDSAGRVLDVRFRGDDCPQ